MTAKKKRSKFLLGIMITCPHKLHSNRESDSFKCDRNYSININNDNVSDFNGIHSVTTHYSWLSGHDLGLGLMVSCHFPPATGLGLCSACL